jgi:hypothetical protein
MKLLSTEDRKDMEIGMEVWVVGCGTSGDNHVDFCKRYLLVLEVYTDGQASRVCGKR